MSFRVAAKSISTVAMLLLTAAGTQACPICILANPKTAGTYFNMTLMMSILPLGMIGGLAYWLKQRYSAPSAARIARRESPRLAELAAAYRLN